MSAGVAVNEPAPDQNIENNPMQSSRWPAQARQDAANWHDGQIAHGAHARGAIQRIDAAKLSAPATRVVLSPPLPQKSGRGGAAAQASI